MGRQLADHKVRPANIELRIDVPDEPGPGGANHMYIIQGPVNSNPEFSPASPVHCILKFQKGPIGEAGINGITQEALLAVVIDRLRGFQSGDFSCRENAIALTHCEDALMWLQKRTLDRMARGVEGMNKR